jgi:fatty acid desaturase
MRENKIWAKSPWDVLLLLYSVLQPAVMVWLALSWDSTTVLWRIAGGAAVAVMVSYNIIVVSHLFTHVPWFTSTRLNAAVSLVNSVNIGQSIQAYHLTHVRNHHRFNNDAKDETGTTRDRSSTYRHGDDGEHQSLIPYALGGALQSLAGRGREVLAVRRLWRLEPDETELRALVSRRPERALRELRQVQADRAAHVLSLVVFAALSWQWTLMCYLPAFFFALTMVNTQNYYRHFGANPHVRAADSVSHYGRLYNLLTFNDGFHQEHHLSPATHWSKLPRVKERNAHRLVAQPRIISPVPAMLGFLHRGRPLLHQGAETGQGRAGDRAS